MTEDEWFEFGSFVRIEQGIGIDLLDNTMLVTITKLMTKAFHADFHRLMNHINSPGMVYIFCYRVKGNMK